MKRAINMNRHSRTRVMDIPLLNDVQTHKTKMPWHIKRMK